MVAKKKSGDWDNAAGAGRPKWTAPRAATADDQRRSGGPGSVKTPNRRIPAGSMALNPVKPGQTDPELRTRPSKTRAAKKRLAG